MYHPNFFYNFQPQYFEVPQESHKSDLEILLESFHASQIHSHPNYLPNYQSQYSEGSQESYTSNLTYSQPNFLYNHHAQYSEESYEPQYPVLNALMKDMDDRLHRSRLETMKMKHFAETLKARQFHFEEPHEFDNFGLTTSMEDFEETLTHSRLESMVENFIETQTIQNEAIRNRSLQNDQTLRQLNNVVESLVTHNMAMETQISMFAQNPLGPFPEEHVDVEATVSEKQFESPESDNEFEDNDILVEESSENNNPLTEPNKEVDEVIEGEEAPIVILNHYTPLIPSPESFRETLVNSQSKTYVEIWKIVHTNAPLFEVSHKYRKSEDHKTKEIITAKRIRLTFEVVDEITKPKLEKLILRIDPEPPPQAQKNELPYRRKKRKGEGYVRWLDKWPWKTIITKSSTEESLSREPP